MIRKLPLLLLCLSAGVAANATHADDIDVMIATWRGCEDACQGFRDYIGSLGHEINLTVRDAGQDKSKLPQFLAEARAAQTDLIVSWGTSVTKSLAGDLTQLEDPNFNHDIPQVFMIVADPVGSGIVESLDKPGRPNITGTYNRMPETVTVQTIRSYLPQFDTLGLIYNEDEPNSTLKYQELQRLSEEQGFNFVALSLPLGANGQPSPEDIAPKVRELVRSGVDFLYVGSSSFLQANSTVLGAAARDAKLPVISPYEEAAREGHALISVAASYYEIGRLAGRQAEEILFGGAEAGDLPVAQMTEFAVTINLSMAKAIGVYPPVSLIQIAEIVE